MIVLTVTATYFTAFVQNTHLINETVAATASSAQPVTIITIAFDQAWWYAGDEQNPSYLYYSAKDEPCGCQFCELRACVDPERCRDRDRPQPRIACSSQPSCAGGVSPPGSNADSSPTVYPTAADHGCVRPVRLVP